MGGTDEFVAHLQDRLRPLGPLHTARFFGGTEFKLHGCQFAMVMAGSLYFAVDDRTRPAYELLGAKPFAYDTRRGQVEVRRYYDVPGEVLEDDQLLCQWARGALHAGALRG